MTKNNKKASSANIDLKTKITAQKNEELGKAVKAESSILSSLSYPYLSCSAAAEIIDEFRCRSSRRFGEK